MDANSTIIIGLCGKMGVGKDYIAQKIIIPFIENNLKQRCLQLSFAYQLKINVMSKHNISYKDVYVKKTNITRSLLQKEGTEQGRNILGEDIWIKHFDRWAQVFFERGIRNIICCDVRFKDEVEYIRSKNGYIIKVIAPNRNHKRLVEESGGKEEVYMYNKLCTHVSECDLDNLEDYDIIVYNDKNENIRAELEKWMTQNLSSGAQPTLVI